MDVIFGEIGQKPDQFHRCEFKVAPKSFVYFRTRNGVDTETAKDFLANHLKEAPTHGIPSADDIPRSANPQPY
jgi:hypothetical protein